MFSLAPDQKEIVCLNLCGRKNNQNPPVLQVYIVILDVLAMFLCHDVRSLQCSLQNHGGKLYDFSCKIREL